MTKKSINLDVDPTIMDNNMRIVKEDPMEENLRSLLSSVEGADAMPPSRLVRPSPGFCVKTFTKTDNKKVFVNICMTDAIPSPQDITNEELLKILNSEDPSSYRVPMSIGHGRAEQDKAGSPITVYDVAINPSFFSKVEQDDLFRTFFLTVVFEGLQDKYQFEGDLQKSIILKNRRSIGTLQSHRIMVRDSEPSDMRREKRPLIEEVGGSGDAPRAGAGGAVAHRLRREPAEGPVALLCADFLVPPFVEVASLRVEVGEDRVLLALHPQSPVELFLPHPVLQHEASATLRRDTQVLTVEMPVVQAH